MSVIPIEAGQHFNGDFRNDFLSVEQLSGADLDRIHAEADAMKWVAQEYGVHELLKGSVYDLVFWDSKSTRTRGSFEHAIARLGGVAIPFDQSASSSGKGETFEDTIEMLDAYLVPERDGIIVRHNRAGSVAKAAEIADAHVINAGDGTGEHPTQAVLDTKTIRNRVPNLGDATITFFGDLAHARTVNSSAPLLATMGVRRMNFVAPVGELPMSPAILENLRAQGVEVTETDDLREVAGKSNIIYTVRTQYELMHLDEPDLEKRKALQAEARKRFTGRCLITPDTIEGSSAFIMHPLPEDQDDLNVSRELRRDPRVIFKEQASNGEWTRMALVALQAGKSVLDIYGDSGIRATADRERSRLSVA